MDLTNEQKNVNADVDEYNDTVDIKNSNEIYNETNESNEVTEKLDHLFIQAQTVYENAKIEKKRKNAENIQKTINELFERCIDNLDAKVMEASQNGRTRLQLFSSKGYEHINELPTIFLIFGTKEEKLGVFDKLGIITLQQLFHEKFDSTKFRFHIKQIPKTRVIVIDLFWNKREK